MMRMASTYPGRQPDPVEVFIDFELMVLLGHATALSIFFVEMMKWLMILPVLIILICYVAGIVVIEKSRQRCAPAVKEELTP